MCVEGYPEGLKAKTTVTAEGRGGGVGRAIAGRGGGHSGGYCSIQSRTFQDHFMLTNYCSTQICVIKWS